MIIFKCPSNKTAIRRTSSRRSLRRPDIRRHRWRYILFNGRKRNNWSIWWWSKIIRYTGPPKSSKSATPPPNRSSRTTNASASSSNAILSPPWSSYSRTGRRRMLKFTFRKTKQKSPISRGNRTQRQSLRFLRMIGLPSFASSQITGLLIPFWNTLSPSSLVPLELDFHHLSFLPSIH